MSNLAKVNSLNPRIVITACDALCSLGSSSEEIWKGILNSQSGIKKLNQRFEQEPGNFDFPVKIASFIENFQISDDILDEKEQRRYDLFTHYALHSIKNCLDKSKIRINQDYPAHRIGCILGVGMGGFPFIGKTHNDYIHRKKARVNPFFIPSIIPSMATGLAAIKFGFTGTNFTVSSACASSGHAIETAMSLISSGTQDAIIVGGSEAVISKFTLTGFHSMKALSKRECEPSESSCPFDKDRDGFVMGEGSGVMILETYENAIKRGAPILCEIAGVGSSCDAHHITAPHPEGLGAIQSMKNALDQAKLNPRDIDYINAHGTSTPQGDLVETNAIKEVFKEHAHSISVSSTKSMTGHLLGAAAALESVICIHALKDQIVPPTINLHHPSPECDLDYTPLKPKPRELKYIMNNSFGFGGTNSTIIFKNISH